MPVITIFGEDQFVKQVDYLCLILSEVNASEELLYSCVPPKNVFIFLHIKKVKAKRQ